MNLAHPAQAQRSLPLLIAMLSMMGPFSIDTYLPSFHDIEETLHATPIEVQQSLTAFLLPFAFMSLWHGALSDAFGRKPVIVCSLMILVLASLGCAIANSIEMLWFFRVLQGLSAGVFVIGRAVVRDVYEGAQAQRVISHVSVLFAIAPAIAPVLGGYLHEWFGWRSVFVFLAGFVGAIAIWSVLALPETHPPAQRTPLHARTLLRNYRATLSHLPFLMAALAVALNFTAIFLYIAGAPELLLRHLEVEETAFFWLFGPVTAGMMLGAWLSGRVAGKLDNSHTLGWSYAAMLAATAGNLLFHGTQPAALPWTVLPLFLYATGMALSMPTLTLIGLDYFPKHRGLASSCQAFVLTSANTATAGLLVPLASPSPLRFSVVSAGLVTAGLACTFCLQRLRRSGVPA